MSLVIVIGAAISILYIGYIFGYLIADWLGLTVVIDFPKTRNNMPPLWAKIVIAPPYKSE